MARNIPVREYFVPDGCRDPEYSRPGIFGGPASEDIIVRQTGVVGQDLGLRLPGRQQVERFQF